MTRRSTAWCAALVALIACVALVWPRPEVEVDPRLRELSATYVYWKYHSPAPDVLRIDAGHFERICSGWTGSSGTVSLESGWLTLHPEDTLRGRWRSLTGQHTWESSHASDEYRYRVVNWGERVYLLEESELQDFCNRVNQGREQRNEPSQFAMREGDWLRTVAGLPNVPAEWKHMLLREDLETTVTEIVNGAGAINLGIGDGLQEGMILIARDVPRPPEIIALGAEPTVDLPLTIVELTSGHCLVAPQFPGNSPPLAVGMRVTSRATDR